MAPGRPPTPRVFHLLDAMTSIVQVRISTRAIDEIIKETLAANDGLETGGILLGHDALPTIVVTAAGGPGPEAVRGPRFFHRDLNHASALAEKAWSVDKSQWVGEWHTHPNGSLEPSPLDATSYLKHVADPDLNFTTFLSVIAIVRDDDVLLAAWAITSEAITLVPIERQPE